MLRLKKNILILTENIITSKRVLSKKQKKYEDDNKTEEESCYSEMNFPKSWKKDKREFCEIFCDLFLIYKNLDTELFPISLIIIMLNISFHTFFFVNAFLFNDNYITDMNLSEIKTEFEYILVKEIGRLLILVSFLCFCIIRLLFWLFSGQENLEDAKQLLNYGLKKDKYISRIEMLKKIFNLKNKIGFFIVCVLHIVYIYFFLIFGNINSHIQVHLLITMVLSFVFYLGLYIIICFIISILRFLALNFCDSRILFDFSKYIQNLFLD